MRTDMKLMAILDGVCLNGDCDPVIGTICIWDYTVCETRAKLFEEWKQDILEKWISQCNQNFYTVISVLWVERKRRGGSLWVKYSDLLISQMRSLHICWVMRSRKYGVGYDTDSRVLTGSRFLWLRGWFVAEHKYSYINVLQVPQKREFSCCVKLSSGRKVFVYINFSPLFWPKRYFLMRKGIC